MKKEQDEYYPPYTISGKGWTARIYRPILTPEERARRMKKIHDAAAAVLLEREMVRMRKEQGKE